MATTVPPRPNLAAVTPHELDVRAIGMPNRQGTTPSAALFACLDEAVDTVNSALVDVRDALEEVQRVSKSYVEGLRAATSEVAGHDRTSLGRSFNKLDTAVVNYLGKIESEVEVQNELARNAAACCDAVLAAANRIARIAFLARVLSLNAAAKSAAIRDCAPLDVIVQQLTRLSAETGELARLAIDAGTALVGLLPTLAESTASIAREVTSFSTKFRRSVRELSPATTELQRQLEDDVMKSDKRLNELVAMSHEALSALRFESEFVEAITAVYDTTETLVALAGEPLQH